MESKENKSIILSIASIAIALIAAVNEEYRVIIVATFLLLIAYIYISDFQKRMDEQSEEIKKLNEKINIYKELIDIKADIKNLRGK